MRTDTDCRRPKEIVEETVGSNSVGTSSDAEETQKEVPQERRRLAVQHLIELEGEDPPDAATLSRELEGAHEPGGLY